MIEPKMGYWCTECGNTYTTESVEMCAYGDCLAYVCTDCDGRYCSQCREFEVEFEVEN
jgi:hypothetical protein